jgi:hypothetical protein
MGKPNLVSKLYLHLFFPSWRFFERTGPISHLYFRTSINGSDFDDWKPYQSQVGRLRSLTKLFYNPGENYYLATRSAIDRLIIQIDEIQAHGNYLKESIRSLDSYHLVVAIANSLTINDQQPSQSPTKRYFQFKLGVAWLDKTPILFEDIFLSDIHEVKR